MPLISLHKYRSVYEDQRLFRKPPLLGPPLSCAKVLLQRPALADRDPGPAAPAKPNSCRESFNEQGWDWTRIDTCYGNFQKSHTRILQTTTYSAL